MHAVFSTKDRRALLRSEEIRSETYSYMAGTFSVSESNVEAVTAYISDQAEHHRKFSSQEELRELLKRHRVPGLKPWAVFCSPVGRLELA